MCYRVIMTSPRWHLNGINVFSTNLARGLLGRGVQVKVLLTQMDRSKYYPDKEMPRPSDIPFETLRVKVENNRYWESHWKAMVDYLEGQSPCIYIPNYDYGHSCVSPKLSSRVRIVGIVHSDDPWHYEMICRLGRYWDAIVAVSKTIRDTVSELDQTFSRRLFTIPYGVYVPNCLPRRSKDRNSPIRLVYTGRLIQHQKRILDIPKIVELLVSRRVPFELTIVGNGPEERKLISALKSLIRQRIVRFLGAIDNDRIYTVLAQNDVFILTSEFEGVPISLLEAMGQGCIPVVTDIRGGVPELVEDGINGYRVPVGDIQAFADRIARLWDDVDSRERMALRAHERVRSGRHSIEDMTESYIDLFKRVIEESNSGRYLRPKGEIIPPPFLQVSPDIFDTWSWRVTAPMRLLGRLLSRVRLPMRHGR